MRPCDHAASPAPAPGCRVCALYFADAAFRRLWNGAPAAPSAPARALPCLHLGEVLDRQGCPCPGRWLRACGVHGRCTVQDCKSCPDYESA